MVYEVMRLINEAWLAWSGLFADVPYGDPYVAVAALMVVTFVLARLAVGRTDD